MTNLQRQTKETNISLSLELYGEGKSEIETGIGFFNHMLEALIKHSQMNLKVFCEGDIYVDFHHTVEDVGIVLGQALFKEIYPIKNIERFGNSVVVMDEAAVSCDMDLSNRAYLYYDVNVKNKIGEFDSELAEEFFRSLVFNANITAHIVQLRGKNRHHILEACFKSLAVALRRAVSENKKAGIPSTKGVL